MFVLLNMSRFIGRYSFFSVDLQHSDIVIMLTAEQCSVAFHFLCHPLLAAHCRLTHPICSTFYITKTTLTRAFTCNPLGTTERALFHP